MTDAMMRRLLIRSSGRRRRPRSVPWPPSHDAATASSIIRRLSIQWHPPPRSLAALLGRPDALRVGGGVSRAFSSPSSSSPSASSPPSSSGAVADHDDGASSSLTPAAAADGGGGSAPEPDPAEVAAAAAAARQEFLAMLEPADAAHAVTLLEAAQQETGKPFSSVPSACNAYLVGLARSNDAALLSKAFQYLAVFRGRFPPDAPRSPSLSARHELICACGRCVRAVTKTLAAQRRLVGPPPAYNQTPQPETATAATAAASDGAQGGEGEDRKESLAAAVSAAAVAGRTGPKPWQVPGPGEDILMFTSLPPSMVSRATVTMFTELAEALWQDYVDHIAWYATPGSANANAIPPAAAPDAAPGAAPPAASADLSEEGAVGDPWPSLAEYLRVTSLLLSDMLYTYNQAGDTRKALDLFNRMRGAPRPVLPNEYATAAIVKNLALADKPEEAFTLLEDLERDGVPVHQWSGMYLAILRGTARVLGRKPPHAERLRRIAQGTLARMREQGFVPSVTALQGLMRVEAKFGNYRAVEALMEEMRARSLHPGPVEYALLIGALGEGGNPRGVGTARRRMGQEGVPPDERVYLALLQAYDKAGDVARARKVFAEAGRRLRFGPQPVAQGGEEQLQQQQQQQQQQPPSPDTHRLYTAMMRCLLRGRAPEESLALFQAYRRMRSPDPGGATEGGRKEGVPVVLPPPDEAMCAIALRAASAVGGVEAARRLYDELAAEERAAEAAGDRRYFSAVGGNAAASLLAAYVDAGDWDGAYAMFDRIRAAHRERQAWRAEQWQQPQQRGEGSGGAGGDEDGRGAAGGGAAASSPRGGKYSISPYNTLIHALAKRGRFEEAQAVAEKAREDGVPFDGTTFRGLARADGGGMLLPWARDDWQPPARVYLVKDGVEEEVEEGGDEGEEGAMGAGSGGAGALWLDMHRLTTAEARELLARELRRLREEFDAAEKAAKEEDGGFGGGGGNDGLRDLMLVTGYRRRQRHPREEEQQEPQPQGKEEGELKAVVRELLAVRGLLFFHPPGNPGCFRVPRASLREYFERERKAESELRFFRLTLLRYIPVASLVALVALVPKGGLPL